MSFHAVEFQTSARQPETNQKLKEIVRPHVDSFNSIFDSNLLDLAVMDIPKVTVFSKDSKSKMTVWLSNPIVGKPVVQGKKDMRKPLFPFEARERQTSYSASLQVTVNYDIDGKRTSQVKSFGSLPIMTQSSKCNLFGKSAAELVNHHEDAQEFGGYFITNGIERLVRLLIVPRRNVPISIIRPSFCNRGPTVSKFGVQMRSVRADQTALTATIHYCNDGEVLYRFSWRKNEYTVPILLIMRALQQVSDRDIFERISMGDYNNSFLTDRVEMLLRSYRKYSMYTQQECIEFIGAKFGSMLDVSEDATTTDVAREFLHRVVYVHLQDDKSKFDLMIFNMKKLYGLVSGNYCQDNPDALQFQETLLAGHLYLAIVKEKLHDYLMAMKMNIATDVRRSPSIVNFTDSNDY